MDHIWEAPSRLKKTMALIFSKKLAIILRQDFLKTLYICKKYEAGSSGVSCDYQQSFLSDTIRRGPPVIRVSRRQSNYFWEQLNLFSHETLLIDV